MLRAQRKVCDVELAGPAKALRIYIGETDHWKHQTLAEALVELFKREGLAGATVIQGMMGFGAHSQIHTASILRLSADLPIEIEVIDRADRIEAIMPKVESMVTEGLIIVADVDVRLFRHRDSQ